jgi:hypothetical protein
MENRKMARQSWLPLGAIFSYCAIVSFPILIAGYYGDDAANSLIRGYTQLHHQNIWQTIWYFIQVWIHSGRLNPLSITLSYLVFYHFPNVIIYQCVRLIFIWLSIFSFAWLIKLISKETKSGILFLLLVPLCWSIRDFFDPLTSFAILLPITVIFSALSLGFLFKFIESNKYFYAAISLISYVCALLTYEASIVIFFGAAIIIWLEAKQQFAKQILPYFLITACYALLSLLLHYVNSHVYDGIQIGSPYHFLTTFGSQFSAAFPLSYRVLGHLPIVNSAALFKEFFASYSLSALMVGLLIASIFSIYSPLKTLDLKKKTLVFLTLMGLNLTITPAILIAITQKYQSMLKIGVGYLPVYLQYFGMACLLLVLLNRLARHKKPTLLFFVSAIGSVIVTFSFMLNVYVVQKINVDWKYPRELVQKAMEQGIMKQVPQNSILFSNQPVLDADSFYQQYANLKLTVITNSAEIDKHKEPIFFIDLHQDNFQSGMVSIFKLENQKLLLVDTEKVRY